MKPFASKWLDRLNGPTPRTDKTDKSPFVSSVSAPTRGISDDLYDFLATRIEVIHLKTCTTPELFWASEGVMLEAFRAWARTRRLRFVTVDEFRAAMKKLFNGPEFQFDDQHRAWVGFRYLK